MPGENSPWSSHWLNAAEFRAKLKQATAKTLRYCVTPKLDRWTSPDRSCQSAAKKAIKQKNLNKSRQNGLVRDDSVNLEPIKATASRLLIWSKWRATPKGGRYRKSVKIDALRAPSIR